MATTKFKLMQFLELHGYHLYDKKGEDYLFQKEQMILKLTPKGICNSWDCFSKLTPYSKINISGDVFEIME